jgi:two-component system, chemotaxis family, CheB/CheR fusion protein
MQGLPRPADTTEPGPPAPGPVRAIVAVGASAGGISVLKRLFAAAPTDAGLAYVVVIHLSPDYESHLDELLQTVTTLPVAQLDDPVTRLEPNRVYVVPPGSNVSSVDTHLRLTEIETERRHRAPIDHFFRTLSQTHDGQSIAIVLSGSGSDGALGIRRVKEAGGLTIAQDPTEAEYDSMPQAAIATDAVDLVLRVDDIAPALVTYVDTRPVIVDAELAEGHSASERTLGLILGLVKARVGRDFTRYRRSTLLRRTRRRMQLHGVERLDAYLEMLRRDPSEATALADEFLVTVTEFFRDPAVFGELEHTVVPRLFEGRGEGDTVRAWSVGCATGEEAYSIAMLLLEHAASLDAPPKVQVFASDLHEASLRRARDGTYPETIEASMSTERLQRYFLREHEAFRTRKDLRDVVVFTPHNVLSDAPFSRLDLIVCRNLLIYLDASVQREVVDLFHYALLPNGFLVLGPSESHDREELFVPVSRARSIYRKHGDPDARRPLPTLPLSYRNPGATLQPTPSRDLNRFAEFHRELLDLVGPANFLVGSDDSVLYLSSSAGQYLQHPAGGLTGDVFRLVRDELRVELRVALQAARATAARALSQVVSIPVSGTTQLVRFDARPSSDPRHEGVVLVLVEPVDAPVTIPTVADAELGDATGAPRVERQLDDMRRRLREVTEGARAGEEELRANNEELQSMNEELRSAMEELETSREELQSVNEELTTANEENRHKVAELGQMTNDLQTLMGATEIATLFLDRHLRILRFTPRVATLFNVRHSDRHRAVGDLTHRFGGHDLVADARKVLERLVPIERELRAEDGTWYLTRLHPYRSAEDRIDGVVITFIDITAHKEAEVSVREANERLERLVEERTVALLHANEELEAFNHSVSHDLRVPLRGIERFTKAVLSSTGGGLGSSERELLTQVVEAARRMSDLIDGLLELSDVARSPLNLDEVDVSALAVAVAGEQRSLHPERELSFEIQPSITMRGDRRLLRVVIANLIENAVKFTSGLDEARIVVGGGRVDGVDTCFVRDNGAGFDMAGRRRLFTPFQRLHGGDAYEGRGIGLALVHRIVARHGGTVAAEAEVGSGATFTFTLPRRAPAPPRATMPDAAP